MSEQEPDIPFIEPENTSSELLSLSDLGVIIKNFVESAEGPVKPNISVERKIYDGSVVVLAYTGTSGSNECIVIHERNLKPEKGSPSTYRKKYSWLESDPYNIMGQKVTLQNPRASKPEARHVVTHGFSKKDLNDINQRVSHFQEAELNVEA